MTVFLCLYGAGVLLALDGILLWKMGIHLQEWRVWLAGIEVVSLSAAWIVAIVSAHLTLFISASCFGAAIAGAVAGYITVGLLLSERNKRRHRIFRYILKARRARV